MTILAQTIKLFALANLVVCGVFYAGHVSAAPKIKSISVSPNAVYAVKGAGFGKKCSRCGVLVKYAGGSQHKAKIKSWADNSISAVIPDLNEKLSVKVTVRATSGVSPAMSYRLKRRYKRSKVFSKTSRVSVGNKGEERIKVATPGLSCGKPGRVFDSADIRFKRKRFGDAQIRSSPKPGCKTCSPLRVAWYHEPTGRLSFDVWVNWRVVEGVCGR